MPLNPEQFDRLSLGGTIGLPSPYPTIGIVALDTAEGSDDVFIRVTHAKSHNEAVVWCMRAVDVVAYEEKEALDPDEAGEDEPIWHIGSGNVVAALKPGKIHRGIVYVPEEAQVLLSLEYGLSAIDSADVASQAGIIPKDRSTDAEYAIRCKRPCT